MMGPELMGRAQQLSHRRAAPCCLPGKALHQSGVSVVLVVCAAAAAVVLVVVACGGRAHVCVCS